MLILDFGPSLPRLGEPLILGDADCLSGPERDAAIQTWRGRMVNEHISARVFGVLLGQLMRAGLPVEWQHRVAGMMQDELRHGLQCASVVQALGGEARAILPPLPDVPSHSDASPIEAALRNVISIGCLSETVAVALIRSEHQATGPESLQKLLASILADEVQHARFGWEMLDVLAPRLSAAERRRLSVYLVSAFHSLREHELAHLPLGPTPTANAEAYGVCEGADARSLFFATVREVIIPGLEKHGLDASAAWRASERLPSAEVAA